MGYDIEKFLNTNIGRKRYIHPQTRKVLNLKDEDTISKALSEGYVLKHDFDLAQKDREKNELVQRARETAVNEIKRIADSIDLSTNSAGRIIILKDDKYDISCIQVSGNALLLNDEDVMMYKTLIHIVRKYPMHTGQLAKRNSLPSLKGKDFLTTFILRYFLREWVMRKTPALNDPSFKYNFSTRCVWVFNGMSEFRRCKTDNKVIGFHENAKLST